MWADLSHARNRRLCLIMEWVGLGTHFSGQDSRMRFGPRGGTGGRGPLPSHLLTNGIFPSEMDQAKVEATLGRPAYLCGAGSQYCAAHMTSMMHDSSPLKWDPVAPAAAPQQAGPLHCTAAWDNWPGPGPCTTLQGFGRRCCPSLVSLTKYVTFVACSTRYSTFWCCCKSPLRFVNFATHLWR